MAELHSKHNLIFLIKAEFSFCCLWLFFVEEELPIQEIILLSPYWIDLPLLCHSKVFPIAYQLNYCFRQKIGMGLGRVFG